MNSLELDIEPFEVNFRGYSDASILASRLLTDLGNAVRDRAMSITRYVGARRFNELINKAIELIPDEIDIPLTTLYTQGGISKDFTIKRNDYMAISMDFSLQDHCHPLLKENTAAFTDTKSHPDF